MSSLLKFIAASTVAFGLLLFRGVVVRDLWYWFVVPLGLSSLSIAHAIGLSGLISYVTYVIRREPESDKTVFLVFMRQLLTAYVLGLLSWGVGWAVAQFM